jgi:hypothetical protein
LLGDEFCTAKNICSVTWIFQLFGQSDTLLKAFTLQFFSLYISLIVNSKAHYRHPVPAFTPPIPQPFRPFPIPLTADITMVARKYIIANLLANARACKNNNFLSRSLGIYFITNGVPRRVVDIIAKFGIYSLYIAAKV